MIPDTLRERLRTFLPDGPSYRNSEAGCLLREAEARLAELESFLEANEAICAECVTRTINAESQVRQLQEALEEISKLPTTDSEYDLGAPDVTRRIARAALEASELATPEEE